MPGLVYELACVYQLVHNVSRTLAVLHCPMQVGLEARNCTHSFMYTLQVRTCIHTHTLYSFRVAQCHDTLVGSAEQYRRI